MDGVFFWSFHYDFFFFDNLTKSVSNEYLNFPNFEVENLFFAKLGGFFTQTKVSRQPLFQSDYN